MAKFFKYKSAAELLAENARLGTDLRLADDLSPLFTPLAIGGRTAAQMLGELIDGGSLRTNRVELTTELYVRESTTVHRVPSPRKEVP